MNALGFSIPVAPPLLPINIDMLPNGLIISQGLQAVRFDQAGVDDLLNVMGMLALLRIGSAAQNAPSTGVIQ